MKTNITKLMMILTVAGMTACANTDVYDETFVENNQKGSYADNFAKKYPNVSLNQSWDFSSKTPYFTFDGSNRSEARTRAGEDYSFTSGNWYEVENTTVDWMQEKLTEGIDHRTLGKPFYMTVPGNDRDGGVITAHRNEVGDKMTSVNGMMLALTDCPVPSNLAGNEAMIIGCEDANRAQSDWDMNDLVLLVYGKKVPKPIEITEGKTVYESKTVRYMIEDLGATDDFDFNDIVIDVTESTAKTPIYVNDVLDSWNTGATTQKAVIRHLGGTLPFILTIGNTTLPEMGGQDTFKSSPNLEFDITGWNINTHNLSVQVRQQATSTVYNHVRFPRSGEAPMIIAVDPWQNWMGERQSVPESWFYTAE